MLGVCGVNSLFEMCIGFITLTRNLLGGESTVIEDWLFFEGCVEEVDEVAISDGNSEDWEDDSDSFLFGSGFKRTIPTSRS